MFFDLTGLSPSTQHGMDQQRAAPVKNISIDSNTMGSRPRSSDYCSDNGFPHSGDVSSEGFSVPEHASPETDGSGVTPLNQRRSSSIPLPSSHVARTQSELQLSIDQEVAERRDVDMFYRLVNGIRERHYREAGTTATGAPIAGPSIISQSEKSVSNIIHTRLRKLEEHGEEDEMHESYSLDGSHHWRMLHSSRANVSDATDEWSITGFDSDGPHQQHQQEHQQQHSSFSAIRHRSQHPVQSDQHRSLSAICHYPEQSSKDSPRFDPSRRRPPVHEQAPKADDIGSDEDEIFPLDL